MHLVVRAPEWIALVITSVLSALIFAVVIRVAYVLAVMWLDLQQLLLRRACRWAQHRKPLSGDPITKKEET